MQRDEIEIQGCVVQEFYLVQWLRPLVCITNSISSVCGVVVHARGVEQRVSTEVGFAHLILF